MFGPALIVLGGRLPELVTDRLLRAISGQPILGAVARLRGCRS
jgi:hypothetical protein